MQISGTGHAPVSVKSSRRTDAVHEPLSEARSSSSHSNGQLTRVTSKSAEARHNSKGANTRADPERIKAQPNFLATGSLLRDLAILECKGIASLSSILPLETPQLSPRTHTVSQIAKSSKHHLKGVPFKHLDFRAQLEDKLVLIQHIQGVLNSEAAAWADGASFPALKKSVMHLYKRHRVLPQSLVERKHVVAPSAGTP